MTDIDVTETDPAVPPPDLPPPEPPRRSRSRAGIAMLIVAALMVVGAIVAVVVGTQARSAASDDRERATTAIDRRHAAANQERAVGRDRLELEDLSNTVPKKFADLGTALDATEAAQRRFADVTNQSAVLFNGGNEAGAATLYQNEGAAALADFTQKNTANQQAMQAAQTALQQLQEALR